MVMANIIAESLHKAAVWIMRVHEERGYTIWKWGTVVFYIAIVILLAQESLIGGLILGLIAAPGLSWVLLSGFSCVIAALLEVLSFCFEKPLVALKRVLLTLGFVVISTLLIIKIMK